MDNLITVTDLYNKANEIAQEFPDKEVSCQYFYGKTGAPVCLYGHALAALGFSADDLNACTGSSINNAALGNVILYLAHKGKMREVQDDEWDSIRIMSSIQARQDSGSAWGESLIFGNKFPAYIPNNSYLSAFEKMMEDEGL